MVENNSSKIVQIVCVSILLIIFVIQFSANSSFANGKFERIKVERDLKNPILLKDGRVLFSSGDIFNPQTNSFSYRNSNDKFENLNNFSGQPSIVLLQNGNVLCLAPNENFNVDNKFENNLENIYIPTSINKSDEYKLNQSFYAWEYNPQTNTFSKKGEIYVKSNKDRYLIPNNNNIIIVNSHSLSKPLHKGKVYPLEIYDYKTGLFEIVNTNHFNTELNGKRIYYVINDNNNIIFFYQHSDYDKIAYYIYDTKSKTFSDKKTITLCVSKGSLVGYKNIIPLHKQNGKFLLIAFAGSTSDQKVWGFYDYRYIYMLDIQNGQTKYVGEFLLPRSGGQEYVELGNDKILIMGGYSSCLDQGGIFFQSKMEPRAEILDLKTGKSQIVGKIQYPNYKIISSILLNDGRVLILHADQYAEVYIPNNWKRK